MEPLLSGYTDHMTSQGDIGHTLRSDVHVQKVAYRRCVGYQIVLRAARLDGRVNPNRLVDGWLLHAPWVRTLQHNQGSCCRGGRGLTISQQHTEEIQHPTQQMCPGEQLYCKIANISCLLTHITLIYCNPPNTNIAESAVWQFFHGSEPHTP